MDKRRELRNYYQSQANKELELRNFSQRTNQIDDFETTVVTAFNSLIRFLDGQTTKTEVVNQLKSISTPDVDKVVESIAKLDENLLKNRLNISPLVESLNVVKRELSLIPKSLPKFEQKETVKVSNLDEIKVDFSKLEKAIKELKLDPKIDIPAAVVNIEKPDLKPIQDLLLDLIKSFNKFKVEIPELPEIPKTDLSKVEKKLDESNKHLKKLVEKPIAGGGGGGGNGSPYTDTNGITKNVILTDAGKIPVDANQDQIMALLNELIVENQNLKLLLQAIANPAYVDKSANQMRSQVTGSLTTVSTVTTVTNLTNIGSFPADHLQRMDNMTAWATNVRQIIV